MSDFRFGEITVVKMAEHYIDNADGFEVPVGAAGLHRNALHCITVFCKVPVGHYPAVEFAVILSVVPVLVAAEIGGYAAVSEQ